MDAHARAQEPVTQLELSAQEYFERASTRTDSDLDGAIADFEHAARLAPDNDDYQNIARNLEQRQRGEA
jgi:hypothetical protein